MLTLLGRLFRTYKEVTQPFWGFIIDLEDFESKLMLYLEERAKNVQGGTGPTRPISATWLAILFAIMAIGSQYHDSPYHVRTSDSQKFIQISFHFLRVANFLLRYVLSRGPARFLRQYVTDREKARHSTPSKRCSSPASRF